MIQKLPTAPSERIELIDAIRGIAVLGILFSNILIFSGFVFTSFDVLKQFDHALLNGILNYLSNAFVSGKFYPIFCMLFGYGFYMQVAKYNNNQSFVTYFSIRMFFLLLIGLLHQLIWPGDVVTIYALIGLLFLFVRKTNQKQDIYLAILFFVISIIAGFYTMMFPSATEIASHAIQQNSYFSLPGIDNTKLIGIVQNEGISGMYYFYIPYYKYLWTFARIIPTWANVIGFFFMGGYLFKSNFLKNHALKIRNLIIFFILGAIGSYLRYYVAYPLRTLDNLFLSLFYISFTAILFKTTIGNKFLKNLIPVGRMALTSYILQSVFCIFIFYGFGFGLFTKLPLYQIYSIALAISIIQIVICKLWLIKFRFGPIEWIWRCLSYRRLIPIKISKGKTI